MRNRTRRLRRLLAVPAIAAVVLVADRERGLGPRRPREHDARTRTPTSPTSPQRGHAAVQRARRRPERRDPALRRLAEPDRRRRRRKHVAGQGRRGHRDACRSSTKGLYTVAWRAISADSHPVQGAFTFGVQTAATGVGRDQARGRRPQATETSDRTVGVLFGVMRFGVFVGLALLLGIVGFVLFLWPSGRVSVRVRQVLYGALELTFLCTVLGFMLQGPYTSGGGARRHVLHRPDVSPRGTRASARSGCCDSCCSW